MFRISRLDRMSERHRQPAIRLHVAALRPPPLAPLWEGGNLDMSTKIVGQTRRSGRWVNRYNNEEIQKSILETIENLSKQKFP